MTSAPWPPQLADKLRELCGQMSCGQAAAILGVSRNAAIGKAKRMGLHWKGTPCARAIGLQKPKDAPRRRMRFKPKVTAKATPEPALPVPAPLNLPFKRLKDHHCRYITTDSKPYLFCGRPAIGCSWCPAHRRIVYQPPKKVSA